MIRQLSVVAALIAASAPVPALEAQQPLEILIGGKPRAHWIASLRSSDATTRQSSCEALGLLGSDAAEAVPALVAAVNDPDQQVRWAAITALGRNRSRGSKRSSNPSQPVRQIDGVPSGSTSPVRNRAARGPGADQTPRTRIGDPQDMAR